MWDVVVQVYLKRAPVALFQTDASGLKKEMCLGVFTLYYVLNDLKLSLLWPTVSNSKVIETI